MTSIYLLDYPEDSLTLILLRLLCRAGHIMADPLLMANSMYPMPHLGMNAYNMGMGMGMGMGAMHPMAYNRFSPYHRGIWGNGGMYGSSLARHMYPFCMFRPMFPICSPLLILGMFSLDLVNPETFARSDVSKPISR